MSKYNVYMHTKETPPELIASGDDPFDVLENVLMIVGDSLDHLGYYFAVTQYRDELLMVRVDDLGVNVVGSSTLYIDGKTKIDWSQFSYLLGVINVFSYGDVYLSILKDERSNPRLTVFAKV